MNIKFLIFLKEYPQFNHRQILYIDHKELVNRDTLDEIMVLINKNLNKSLIIRKTPGFKNKIYDEIIAAMDQGRYLKNMNKTTDFVDNLISSGKVSENVRICNTGLIVYINRRIQPLLNSVYDKCMEHQQPECQIYWSIFSQKYKNEITEIEWSYLKNKRISP